MRVVADELVRTLVDASERVTAPHAQARGGCTRTSSHAQKRERARDSQLNSQDRVTKCDLLRSQSGDLCHLFRREPTFGTDHQERWRLITSNRFQHCATRMRDDNAKSAVDRTTRSCNGRTDL